MLCRCQVPAKEVVTRDGGRFFGCGHQPFRCKQYAIRPLIAYNFINYNPTTARERFVSFELALYPQTREEAFYVRPINPNDPSLKALLDDTDRFPEVLFNIKTKHWLFPMRYYKMILDEIKAIQPPICIYEVPSYALEFYRKTVARSEELKKEFLANLNGSFNGNATVEGQANLSSFRTTPGYEVPSWAQAKAAPRPTLVPDNDPIYRKLHSFQREGIRFVLEHGGRAMIADEMGLGKTVQAIMVAHNYREEWPVLVICPGSLCDNWAKEFSQWLTIPRSMITVVRAASTSKKNKPTPESIDLAKVVIVGYQNLKQLTQMFHQSFKVVIIDESHFIKTPDAIRTKDTQAICNTATRTVLLSGTPAMSRPFELYPQLKLINQHFMSQYQFSQRYCGGYTAEKYGAINNGHCNTNELNMLLRHYLIRRCKADVLGDMPSKIRRCLYLSITDKEMKALSDSVTSLRHQVNRGGSNAVFKKDVSLELKVQTAKAKIPAIKDYLKEVLDELADENYAIMKANEDSPVGEPKQKPRKIILFAHHLELLGACANVAEASLKKKNFEFIRISGETSMTDRDALCNRFREVPSCCVAVLSMQAMGTGHNLTCANKVIFTELDWNPSTHLQCEDRVHRIGQEEECVIQYLLCDGTADEVVWPLLQEKLDVTLAVLANSGNDSIVLGGGGALQDKEVVERKDVPLPSFNSGAAGGNQTLDKWFQKKPSATEGEPQASREESPTRKRSPTPPAVRPSNRPNTTATLRAGSQEFVKPVKTKKPPQQPTLLNTHKQQSLYQQPPTGPNSQTQTPLGQSVPTGNPHQAAFTTATPHSVGPTLSQSLNSALQATHQGQPNQPAPTPQIYSATSGSVNLPQQSANPPQRTVLDFSKTTGAPQHTSVPLPTTSSTTPSFVEPPLTMQNISQPTTLASTPVLSSEMLSSTSATLNAVQPKRTLLNFATPQNPQAGQATTPSLFSASTEVPPSTSLPEASTINRAPNDVPIATAVQNSIAPALPTTQQSTPPILTGAINAVPSHAQADTPMPSGANVPNAAVSPDVNSAQQSYRERVVGQLSAPPRRTYLFVGAPQAHVDQPSPQLGDKRPREE